MRFRAIFGGLLLVMPGFAHVFAQGAPPPPTPPSVFGEVKVVAPPDNDIRSVTLLLSGDDGWTAELAAFAEKVADLDTLVVGIDLAVLKTALAAQSAGRCFDLGRELVRLSRAVESSVGVKGYIQPLMIGWGTGAGLAYAALIQASPNSFKGVFSLGFCQDVAFEPPLCPNGDLPTIAKPRPGGIHLGAVDKVAAPWTVIAGIGPACKATDAEDFVDEMDGATAVSAPPGAKPGDWFDVFSDAYLPIAGTDFSFRAVPNAVARDLKDIPIVEIRDPTAPPSDAFIVMFSGDGGWAELDNEVSHRLAAQGLPVVGISSLRYFWSERKPDAIAADVARIVAHYSRAWNKPRFILAGFSFGADVVPFVATPLARKAPAPLAGLVMLSPSRSASFVFHIAGWVGDNPGTARTKPEIEKIKDLPIVCIYGTEEDGSLCPPLDAPNVTKIEIPGDHHFDEDYAAAAQAVLQIRAAIARK